MLAQHRQAVGQIAAKVRQFYDRKEPFRISHGSTNSTRPRRPGHALDISKLANVLEVNAKARTALVEPNVPMDRLVASTLKYGLVPPVVMEFPGITVGGGYAGTAGESSSFRHGFFNDTINSVEMILANGEITRASPTENSDLFYGAAGAVGSLGITTMVELQLIEAKKYVKATYHRKGSVAEAIKDIQTETTNDAYDYVDGMLFSKEHGVVVTGEMTNEKPDNTTLQTFSDPWDPWFYLHVKDRTNASPSPVTEFIPLAEYLFRYDRGGFWVGASAFDYFKFPFNRYTRWWLDDFLHTRMLYKALHASGESSRYIVQDLAFPYSTAEQFINKATDSFGIWPLWLCPLRQTPPPTMHPHTGEVEADGSPKPMLNVGLWGWGPTDPATFISANRELEHQIRSHGGMKWLYAHTYYPENEFWSMFDRPWYDALREKYSATSLPSVYDKVKIDTQRTRQESNSSWGNWMRSQWPFGGMYGIRKAIQSKEYMHHRETPWKRINERDPNSS